MKHYTTVTKLVHYTSKFNSYNDDTYSSPHPALKFRQLSTNIDSADSMNRSVPLKITTANRLLSKATPRFIDSRQFRLAPIWPEWNEADINSEQWDTGALKRRDAAAMKNRIDTKITHPFDDPEGKIELPPSFKVEQWKRPNEYLTSDKTPVIVDSEIGIQTFDLISANQHLHHSEMMRRIICEITALWDICRKERNKHTHLTPHYAHEFNTIERTWRPWEHIYALNKVSRPPFITPYNPSGKYVVRLFFLGSWRKIIVDDTIPFDSENRCLLPQTAFSHELWPMLLSKALFKIIFLDFYALNEFLEYSEVSIIHFLTGWVPESIPLKYAHTEKVWNFLRYDRSNQHVYNNENQLNKSSPNFGPLPLFKWTDSKADSIEETILINDPSDHPTDKSLKGAGATSHLHIPRDPSITKSIINKDNRTNVSPNLNTNKDTKKLSISSRGAALEDSGHMIDDLMAPEAPKLVVFGVMSQLPSTLNSSYKETADRSERLRRYNLNDTFSTSVLLTSIRDTPLEPPLSTEYIPTWKQIRPRKPKILPHAEPIIPRETKPDRWVEVASPYINYPTASALHIKSTARSTPTAIDVTNVNISSRLSRSVKRLNVSNHSNFNELDEDEESEHSRLRPDGNINLVHNSRNLSFASTRQESNVIVVNENSDESLRSEEIKSKSEIHGERIKSNRKSTVSATKLSFDTVSMKSKSGENDQHLSAFDAFASGNHIEQHNSPINRRKSIRKLSMAPKIWMDFDDFCTCFTSIIVFHNPRGYQYSHSHTELKFIPYQQPTMPVIKERKREPSQNATQNLHDDKSSIYVFVDSPCEMLDKNIELIISVTCLSRWYDAPSQENVVSNEKTVRGTTEKSATEANSTKNIVSQKEILPQVGSLIAEVYSWKSLTMGQPILRLHTTATKAAFVTLKPGRHVLKFTNTCPLAFNLQILSNTTEFALVDEDQLLNKVVSVPEDAEFILRAEELFHALDDSIQNFHLIDEQENKLSILFSSYCEQAPKSIELNSQICSNVFNQALYSTLRTILGASGSGINVYTQFAWRCFTNDLLTLDILSAYEGRRPAVRSPSRHSARATANVTTGKKSMGSREKTSDDKSNLKQQTPSASDIQEVSFSDFLNRESNENETKAIINIQKTIRGFLQRRIANARTAGTPKNLLMQQILQANMSVLKADQKKSALLLFKNFISLKPELIQCFSFRNDDWNMVRYRDYNGMYQEQPANRWFVLLREIFYFNEDSLISARLLTRLPNTVLRIINNDTYDEMPLVFNRLKPALLKKNKRGYTFFAEGMSLDQAIPNDRFRLRLVTSYASLPETPTDPLTSSFVIKEFMDYYVPNKEQIICRYRVNIADLNNQLGLNYHLASIHFTTSKSDVLMRLSVLDNNEEIAGVEGRGTVILPSILFMRTITNLQPPPSPTRPVSKSTAGTRKKDSNNSNQGTVSDSTTNNARLDKDKTASGTKAPPNNRIGLLILELEETFHKYVIQVTLLRKSWPLTAKQWQFAEQLQEQEKNEMKVFSQKPLLTQISRPISGSPNKKRTGQTTSNTSATTSRAKNSTGTSSSRSSMSPSSRTKSSKETAEKTIDKSKPHWILRIVSEADKADELTVKKDTERKDELMNMKRAWETMEAGRAEKAMETRQKFLDFLQTKTDESSSSGIVDDTTNVSEARTDEETTSTINSAAEQHPVTKQSTSTKKNPSSSKKESAKDESAKQRELTGSFISSFSHIEEPLLDEPPMTKRKSTLPAIDLTPFVKQKSISDGPIVADALFEQEDLRRRQSNFFEYAMYLEDIRLSRREDQNNRYKEKLRQLEDYVNLQAKVDQIRRSMNEPREAFRQRYLEAERLRLQELVTREQQLIDEEKARTEAAIKSAKKKSSAGKKKHQ